MKFQKNYKPIFASGDSPFNPVPFMAQQNPDPWPGVVRLSKDVKSEIFLIIFFENLNLENNLSFRQFVVGWVWVVDCWSNKLGNDVFTLHLHVIYGWDWILFPYSLHLSFTKSV